MKHLEYEAPIMRWGNVWNEVETWVWNEIETQMDWLIVKPASRNANCSETLGVWGSQMDWLGVKPASPNANCSETLAVRGSQMQSLLIPMPTIHKHLEYKAPLMRLGKFWWLKLMIGVKLKPRWIGSDALARCEAGKTQCKLFRRNTGSTRLPEGSAHCKACKSQCKLFRNTPSTRLD